MGLFGHHKSVDNGQAQSRQSGRRYVIRKSICTGERVAGYLDENGKFVDITLINTDAELRAFCKQYHVDRNEIKEIY